MIRGAERKGMWLLSLLAAGWPVIVSGESGGATAEPRLVAEVLDPGGKTSREKLHDTSGQIQVEVGSVVRLSVDPEYCGVCEAKIIRLMQEGEENEYWKDKGLPVALAGGKLPLAAAGTVVATIEIQKDDETKATGDYVVHYGLPDRWWVVADTVAYAVTRQQGNTAIAGAGVFFDLPHWKFLNATRGFLRLSVVVHLLPPAAKDDPADLGIAPIGISLFGNRVVAGIGWNISRQGLRPPENNRYVYVGFSASQLLNPKP